MARGRTAEVGDTYWSANGYHYTKTEEGYRLTHHIIAEKTLGRSLRADEMVRFKDKDKKNFDPKNIEVIQKRSGSLRKRKAVIEARIDELQAELEEINTEISRLR